MGVNLNVYMKMLLLNKKWPISLIWLLKYAVKRNVHVNHHWDVLVIRQIQEIIKIQWNTEIRYYSGIISVTNGDRRIAGTIFFETKEAMNKVSFFEKLHFWGVCRTYHHAIQKVERGTIYVQSNGATCTVFLCREWDWVVTLVCVMLAASERQSVFLN